MGDGAGRREVKGVGGGGRARWVRRRRAKVWVGRRGVCSRWAAAQVQVERLQCTSTAS